MTDERVIKKVELFAPILAFDRAPYGLPMDAQRFFVGHMHRVDDDAQRTTTWVGEQADPYAAGWVDHRASPHGDDYRLMVNDDPRTLNHGDVPTYFQASENPTTGALRITYWWFFGFQHACNETEVLGTDSGAHMGDWECLTVTTTADQSEIEWVTYAQHGGWYTLPVSQGPTMVEGRPVAFVAKIAHGLFHESFDGGAWVGTPARCAYYKDARNPVGGVPDVPPPAGADVDYWWTSTGPLLDLDAAPQPWMAADAIGSIYEPSGYEITHWKWGFNMRYCDHYDPTGITGFFRRLFGGGGNDPACLGHAWATPVSTHPTQQPIDWAMPPCADEGCERGIHAWP